LNPLNRGFSIVVHEHKFSEDRREWLERSGRFNVGLVAGLKGSEFDKCVARWRNQVLERCDVSHSEGRCGDQTYLNEWPTLYPSMHILEEPGAGLGPWNIKNHEVTKQNGKILIDGQPFYFFHFSSMEFLFFSKLVVIYICAAGYLRMRKNERFIYKSYVKKLIDIYKYYGFRPMVKRDTKTLFASLIFRRTSFTVSKI
jgi:hypothetical protein